MRRLQAAALKLFEKRGFENVTVEEVAAAAQAGPASVYRNFSTKEQLILWDEYDPLLFESISLELAHGERPLESIRDGLIRALSQVYDGDAKRILRRARLIQRTPSLRAQSLAQLQSMRAGLAEVLKPVMRDVVERELLAAVVAAALDVAILNWVHSAGATPLKKELKRVFAFLQAL